MVSSFIAADQFQRYHYVQQIILAAAGKSILEVGGAHSPLPQLLTEHRVVLLDGKQAPQLDAIGTGLSLPFRNGAFDVVVSTDVLEHVPPEKREAFVNELLRVASQMVILGFPHNTPEASRADRELFEFVRKNQGVDHSFLSEHLD